MNSDEREKIVHHVTGICGADRIKQDFYKWLLDTGYYKCPAAKRHHGNYSGGLFNHSVEVTKALIDLTYNMGLTWKDDSSPIIIGLFHDVCKLVDYEYTTDNIGNMTIEYNPTVESGHGSKSIMLLAPWIRLTEEEVYCIRYHMGAYTDKSEWQYYNAAIDKYPNVFWTHTADMMASKLKGI